MVTSALGFADGHARLDGFGSESRKQRRKDAAILECAERGNIKLRYPPEQREHAVVFPDAVLGKRIGETVHLRGKRRIGEIANGIVARDPAQCELVAAARLHMAIDRLIGDVETTAGESIEQGPRLRPRECPHALLVVGKVRTCVILRAFPDSIPLPLPSFGFISVREPVSLVVMASLRLDANG